MQPAWEFICIDGKDSGKSFLAGKLICVWILDEFFSVSLANLFAML
jgi:hypothetical protein